MRKDLFLSVLVIICLGIFSAPVRANSISLVQEQVMNEHAGYIQAQLASVSPKEGQNKVAVLTIRGDTANQDVRAKTEAALLETGKFELIDRANLQRIITEIEFQEGDEIDPKSAKELKIKGVDYVVVGSASVSGGTAGHPYVVKLNLSMVNCSSAGKVMVYNRAVQKSVSDIGAAWLQGLGAPVIILVGVLALIVLLIVFRIFGGARTAALNTIFATVNDYLLADKKLRESTGVQLRKIKNRLKDACAAAEKGGQSEMASAISKAAQDLDLLAQDVTGAPFGQDVAKARAIPRDVAERLKAADLAFTDRVLDLEKNVARLESLTAQDRFEGLDTDIKSVQGEITSLKDKFDERGRILRSF